MEMTKQVFGLIPLIALILCVAGIAYIDSPPDESERKDLLAILLPLIMFVLFIMTIAWLPLYSHMK